jgi:predicted MPP superfamily phosphohydrolase
MIWLLLIPAVPVAVFLYAVFIERLSFKIRKVKIKAEIENPISILHISDLHFRSGQRKKAKFLKSLGKLNPDLVINTGDNLGGVNQEDSTVSALKSLLTLPGAFVFGGNDYKGPVFKNPLSYLTKPSSKKKSPQLEIEKLTEGFAGWVNLNNDSKIIELNGQKIQLMGLDDPHEQFDNPAKLQKTVESKKVAYKIGVVHAPYHRAIQQLGLQGADLVLAGHTHGGQVCLPSGRALVTNCDLPTEFAKGASSWSFDGQDVELNVSAGLGTSIFAPFRLFCPPEVTLIEISS